MQTRNEKIRKGTERGHELLMRYKKDLEQFVNEIDAYNPKSADNGYSDDEFVNMPPNYGLAKSLNGCAWR
jgi:hypothetical protein